MLIELFKEFRKLAALYYWWMLSEMAHIAQQVEHFLGKEEVIGSNPIVSTNFLRGLLKTLLFWITEMTWKNEQTEYDAAFKGAKFN